MSVECRLSWEVLESLVQDADRGCQLPPETGDALGDEIVRCEILQGSALYRQLLCLRLFEQSDGWEGWTSLEAWLSSALGLPYKTANERLRVARSLGRLPKINEAFRLGRISYTKVRAIHDVATPENEETLLEQALWASGEQLRRLTKPLRAARKRSQSSQAARERELRVSFIEHPDEDLIEVQATLLPEDAAVFRKALEVALELLGKQARSGVPAEQAGSAAAEPAARGEGVGEGEASAARACHGHAASRGWSSHGCGGTSIGASSAAAELPQRRLSFVDALAYLAESFLADPPQKGVPNGRRELIIHAYPEAASDSKLGRGLLETGDGLSEETAERLACDAPTVVMRRGPEGEVLDVGRKTRRINRKLGRALEVRDPCCRFPGCSRRAMLDAHHLVPWSEGGKANLGNLVRLCRSHHRDLHEGGWTVRRSSGGELEFVDPRGRLARRPGDPSRVAAREAHEVLVSETLARGVPLDPAQLRALDRGGPIDYDYATSVLAHCCGFERDPSRPDELPPALRWLQQQDCA